MLTPIRRCYIDTAIDAVNARRAVLGAAISRLEHTVDNLENNAVNHSASRSRILDADYAAETTELARTQIIQQAGTAIITLGWTDRVSKMAS